MGRKHEDDPHSEVKRVNTLGISTRGEYVLYIKYVKAVPFVPCLGCAVDLERERMNECFKNYCAWRDRIRGIFMSNDLI